MTDFWVTKMRSYFHRVDFDKDGAITRKDFELMAQKFFDLEKRDETRKNDVKAKMLLMWDTYGAGDKSLSKDAFVESCKKHITNEKAKADSTALLSLIFQVIDGNGDGMIQGDEFEVFFNVYGLDAKMAADSFKAIDTNNDGQLSLDEFVTGGIDFFFGQEDNNPHKLFWGPIVA